MVKIVVNPGRRVWDRENHREATEGQMLNVSDVEAKVLKFRDMVSDAPDQDDPEKPQQQPPPPPMPEPAPPPVPPQTPPQRSAQSPVTTTDTAAPLVAGEEGETRRRPTYRRRDMSPENGG
jgi:hypothetical protein